MLGFDASPLQARLRREDNNEKIDKSSRHVNVNSSQQTEDIAAKIDSASNEKEEITHEDLDKAVEALCDEESVEWCVDFNCL